jgi:AraC-like DNA-binding protein
LEYLIVKPDFLPQTPNLSHPYYPMDVLSEVLRAVRLEGAIFFNGEFTAPWCLNSSPSRMAPLLMETGGHLIIFHFLIEGKAYVKVPDQPPKKMVAGDIVIVPHGTDHLLGNGVAKPVDSVEKFARNLTAGLKVAHLGGGGATTKFVCGYMVCEPRQSEVFLGGLPQAFVVSTGKEPSGVWFEQSIRLSVEAVNADKSGSRAVLAKMSELLFIEALRRYIHGLPAEQTGWLAGARDPMIGQALSIMHQDPAYPWSIEHLVRKVGVSRTRLAERFRHYLGQSPMAYLANWRLILAAEKLQAPGRSVAEIAAEVGYGSEAALNRAFKRHYGVPPAQFRKARANNGKAEVARAGT